MLIVCHLMAGGVLFSEEEWPQSPRARALFWLFATVAASLILLPRMKGVVVAHQWALYMHGFGKDHA